MERVDKKQCFLFDWDDNIIFMGSRIHMERLENGTWVRVDVPTDEFRHLRTDPLHRLIQNPDPFLAFRDNNIFLEDLEKAITNKAFGPSFKRFKQCLIEGRCFGIITARGHSIKAMKEGVKIIINRTLTAEEKAKMIARVGSINSYINEQTYHPVSSPYFARKFKLDEVTANKPELGKAIAFRDYVQKNTTEGAKMSIGFSDDDKRNLKVIENLITSELQGQYPHIQFVMYDTSNPKRTIRKAL